MHVQHAHLPAAQVRPTVLAYPTPGARNPGGLASQAGTGRCPSRRRCVPTEAHHPFRLPILVGKVHYRAMRALHRLDERDKSRGYAPRTSPVLVVNLHQMKCMEGAVCCALPADYCPEFCSRSLRLASSFCMNCEGEIFPVQASCAWAASSFVSSAG
jgi:hypothetical protein